MASPPPVHVHRRPPLPAARHAPVIEIDPPNDPRGTGQIDRAGARVLLEIQPRSGRERLAVPERDLHIEQLQVSPRDDDADAPEPAFSRGKDDVVIEAEVHDVILAATEGRFRSIRIVVAGGDLELFDVKVTFGDGETFSPATRLYFKENSRTRTIDLPGAARIIRRIDFYYRSVPGGGQGRATVHVYGRR